MVLAMPPIMSLFSRTSGITSERVNSSRAAVRPAGPAPMITAVRTGGLRLGGALISSLSQRTAPGTAHGFHTQKYPKQAAPNGLVQIVRAIQGIALFRNEARIPNEAAQLLFCCAVMSAGGRNHVLFDHDAADVVATETQAQLADFQSRGDPGRLNI